MAAKMGTPISPLWEETVDGVGSHEEEIHPKLLAFSILHDHTLVRMYGHYAVIDGQETTFYRHPIHKFDFMTLDGK